MTHAKTTMGIGGEKPVIRAEEEKRHLSGDKSVDQSRMRLVSK